MMRTISNIVESVCFCALLLLLGCVVTIGVVVLFIWWLLGGKVNLSFDANNVKTTYVYKYFTVVDTYEEVLNVQKRIHKR